MDPFEADSLNLTPLDDQGLLSGQFWGELRVFLAVAKAKSFNRAAELLGTSQPTVSKQVKRLQDLIGSQLFVPTTHGVKLTSKGQALARELTKLDQALFALTSDLKGETKEAEGLVRVSITDGLNTFFVAPALQSFSTAFPKIQLHLKSPINLSSLRENQTDVMVGFSSAEAAGISVQKLGCLHLLPVAARPYIDRHGLPTRAALAGHWFLQTELYTGPTEIWGPWLSLVSQGRVSHFCDNTMAYGMLVKAGMGIGLLGSYTVLEPTAVPLELDCRISLPLYASALTERLNSRPVRIVFDWLCDLFGPENPWFARELHLGQGPSRYDAGIKQLFNF